MPGSEIVAAAMTDVIAVPAFQDNYIWLIRDADNRAVIVDPGEAQPVLAVIERLALQPCAILITHHHYDHVGGVGEILARYPVPVFGPAKERIGGVSHPLSEGQSVTIPSTSLNFNVLDVPGHTAGHIAYYDDKRLFCGDTLFGGGCGRLFEGTARQMYDSLQKIARLPESTLIYCAHEYTRSNLAFAVTVEPDNAELRARIDAVDALRHQHRPTIPSTLGEEKRTNPFLRCDSSAARAAAALAGEPAGDPHEIFAILRRRKDTF